MGKRKEKQCQYCQKAFRLERIDKHEAFCKRRGQPKLKIKSKEISASNQSNLISNQSSNLSKRILRQCPRCKKNFRKNRIQAHIRACAKRVRRIILMEQKSIELPELGVQSPVSQRGDHGAPRFEDLPRPVKINKRRIINCMTCFENYYADRKEAHAKICLQKSIAKGVVPGSKAAKLIESGTDLDVPVGVLGIIAVFDSLLAHSNKSVEVRHLKHRMEQAHFQNSHSSHGLPGIFTNPWGQEFKSLFVIATCHGYLTEKYCPHPRQPPQIEEGDRQSDEQSPDSEFWDRRKRGTKISYRAKNCVECRQHHGCHYCVVRGSRYSRISDHPSMPVVKKHLSTTNLSDPAREKKQKKFQQQDAWKKRLRESILKQRAQLEAEKQRYIAQGREIARKKEIERKKAEEKAIQEAATIKEERAKQQIQKYRSFAQAMQRKFQKPQNALQIEEKQIEEAEKTVPPRNVEKQKKLKVAHSVYSAIAASQVLKNKQRVEIEIEVSSESERYSQQCSDSGNYDFVIETESMRSWRKAMNQRDGIICQEEEPKLNQEEDYFQSSNFRNWRISLPTVRPQSQPRPQPEEKEDNEDKCFWQE